MLGDFFIAAGLLATFNLASASVPEVIGAPQTVSQLELRIAATNPNKSYNAFSPVIPCDTSCIENQFKLGEKDKILDAKFNDNVSYYEIMDARNTNLIYIDTVLKAQKLEPVKAHQNNFKLFSNDLYYVVNKVAGGSVYNCGPDKDMGSLCELLYKDKDGYLYRVMVYGDSLATMRVFDFNIVNDLPGYRDYSDSDLSRTVRQHKLQYSLRNDKALYINLIKDEYTGSNNYFVKYVETMHSNTYDAPQCVPFVALAFNYAVSDMSDATKSAMIDQMLDRLSMAGCLKS